MRRIRMNSKVKVQCKSMCVLGNAEVAGPLHRSGTRKGLGLELGRSRMTNIMGWAWDGYSPDGSPAQHPS
jgi:hypothetical protein